ncbi:MAG: hypothetical protein KF729_05470 [Sandaracinaceae bacterium]|nr:hypothetical protein [Sandaracinaceae bacterium]
MSDDKFFESSRRFEIYVPSPKARINLGAANLKDEDEGPFGYTGVSIQSGDAHLFIDANKHTLFQTGVNYCGQVGGSWSQFSNADMTLSATANVNLSADRKIVISSGAGMGQITAKDHGSTIRLVAYNNLALHYQVDAIQTSLFEFFHGRREHEERSALAKLGGVDDPYFDAGGASATELATGVFTGGFLAQSTKSLRELLPVAAERTRTDIGKRAADLDPVFHLDGILLKGIAGSKDDPAKLEYGFSAPFKSCDPYSLIDTSKITNPIIKALAKFKNVIAKLRRFADVTLKYAHLLTDNFLIKRAVAAMDAINKLVSATSSAYNLSNDVLGYWIKDGEAGAGQGGRDMPVVGRFADEFNSGMAARIPDGSLDDVGSEARAAIKGKKAEITSNAGPFDLSALAPGAELVVAVEHPSRTHVFTLEQLDAIAVAGTPAKRSVTAGLDCVVPAIRVQITTNVASMRGVSAAELAAWAQEKLGQPVDATSASGLGHIVRPDGSKVRRHLRNEGAILDSRKTFTVGTAPQTQQVNLKFRDVITLGRVDQSRSVTLSIDGALVRVPLDSSRIDQSDDAKGRASVRELFASAIGTSGKVGDLSGSSFEVQTHSTGASASIEVVDGDAASLTALALVIGAVVNGTDPAATATAGRGAVTAAQLVALVAGAQGVSAKVDGTKLALGSDAAAESGKDSKITVSGALADAVFSTKTKTETWTFQNEYAATTREAAAEYNQLVAWNFELQKLPEDTRNLLRPVRDSIGDAVSTLSSLDGAIASATEVVSGNLRKGLPGPKRTIGLIANDGIALGTQSRLVGAGGKGIVFIADGGTASENHDKFFPKKVEHFVNVALAWDPIDKYFDKKVQGPTTPDDDKPPSLGFRVYSDSTVDLAGTYAAQLLALGRGKVNAATPDGKTEIGIGIARIAASHAVDIAGYRRVVVAARNAGTADDDGGRLDLLGQTIFLGGFNEAGAMKDFDHTANKGAGLEALDLASIAGHEHLEAATLAELKDDVKAYGWTEKLRKDHAPTNFVRIHAAKETTAVVGGFMLHVTHADGFALGTRKKDEDPSKNDVDTDKAHFLLQGEKLELRAKADKTFLLLTEKSAKLQLADDAGPKLSIAKAGVRLELDKSKNYLYLATSLAQLRFDSSKVTAKSDGVNIEGNALTFKGQQVKIG